MLSPDLLLSLRELLRARRELPAAEVTRLLETLPAQLDQQENGSAAALIYEVAVCFEAPPPGGLAEVAKLPVAQWPTFRLHVEDGGQQDAGSTIVGGLSLESAPAAARMSALMYEMLGGRIRNEALMKGKFSPLAELDEAGNHVLKRALSKKGYADCRTFWKEWLEVVRPARPSLTTAVATRTWQIPPPLLGIYQGGEVLELSPEDRPAVPTRLVARAMFRIGRSRRMADLSARSATSGASGEAIKELSRVHVVGERLGAGIGFRDGNGERPSVNGSAWNGVKLTAELAAPVTQPGMLMLSPSSCRYRLEVAPLAHRPLLQTPVENLAGWSGPSQGEQPAAPSFGAVAFRHPRGAMVVRQSVWLLSGVGAEVFPTGEFAWSEEKDPSLVFLHRHGAFWLANEGLEDGVKVNEVTAGRGQIAPLIGGQTLQFGGVTFRVAIT